mgnify:CR=1 FL=1
MFFTQKCSEGDASFIAFCREYERNERHSKAAQVYESACEIEATYCVKLGLIHANGFGLKGTTQPHFLTMKRVAMVMTKLRPAVIWGCYFENGSGVANDLEEAVAYYEISFDHGRMQARARLNASNN